MKTTKVPGECYRVEGHPDILIMKFTAYARRQLVTDYIAFRRTDTTRELARASKLADCVKKLEAVLK